MRTRRPLLAGISYVCTLLVFLLFSFPNHCDTCAYRNITLYACSMAPGRPTAGSPCTVPPSGLSTRRPPGSSSSSTTRSPALPPRSRPVFPTGRPPSRRIRLPAVRAEGAGGAPHFDSATIPKVEMMNFGMYAEHRRALSPTLRLTAGRGWTRPAPTPGWAIVNLKAGSQYKGVREFAGVKNLLDKYYTGYLSCLRDPVGVKVPEPGRTLHANVQYAF